MMGEIQAYASMEMMDALANGMTCLDVSLVYPSVDKSYAQEHPSERQVVAAEGPWATFRAGQTHA